MAEKPVAKSSGGPPPAKPIAKPSGGPAPAKPATPAEPPKAVHIGGESFVERVRPHIKKIAIGAVILAVVLGVMAGVGAIRERRQEDTTEKLDRVLEVAKHSIRAKDQKADPKQPSFGDTKERAAAVLDAIAKQGADAVDPAFRGGQLLDAGKIDEAITEYRTGVAGQMIQAVLCREGLGLALEARAAAEKEPAPRQKGFEEALAAFVAMQPDEAGLRRSYALYHQARIQLLLGKRDEAKALFEKAQDANKNADREIADLIEKRLAALGSS